MNKVPRKLNEQLISHYDVINPKPSVANQLYKSALLNEVQNNYNKGLPF
jgi:hypothetical protein